MSRVVKDLDKEQRDIEKIRAQETAERMKAMVADYKKHIETDMLDSIARMPLSDLQIKQAQYKASLELLKWLEMEIAKGKKVTAKRETEGK